MCCGGLISLDRALRYSQNVEFGLVFVLNRVEEVKSTYIEIAAYPAESFLFLRRWTKAVCATIITSFHYNSEHLSSLVTK